MRLRPSPFALMLALAACHDPARPTTPDPDPVPTQPASRQLARDTTFAELVGRARSIEASGDAETTSRCVLRRHEGALTVEASIAPAIRPLPDARDDLTERVMQARALSVLSRWGRVGQGALALVTITESAPLDADSVVIVITPRGLYLRLAGAETPDRARGNWALGRLRDALASLEVGADDTVVVTAEGAMTMESVADVLAAITPLGVHAVLAVALPEGTPIPEEPLPAARSDHETCDALPPVAEDAAAGDLRIDDVRRGAAALSDIALACARSTSSVPVARGGRVDLLMRVGPDGGVVDACARADEIHDDGFRMCLIGAARRLAFTPPVPPGYVDVIVPVRLRADASYALSPMCE